MTITSSDLEVKTLGACRIASPLAVRLGARRTSQHYVDEGDRVLFDDTLTMVTERGVPVDQLPGFEPAGPRKKIYFDPSKIRVGIVTCGGLCPGLNDVIRALVIQLHRHYGARRIVGFRNGYRGFIAKYGDPVMELNPEAVAGIDERGGTILGTSRGRQDPEEIVDCLERMDVNVVFVIGGDGSMRGASQIAQIALKRDDNIAVVGIPKTIDNDIPFIDHSFGFQTAFGQAAESLRSARVEARSAPNGIGLVKVMGRHSGFIACSAALAKGDADFVLIPEVQFDLDGTGGLLAALRQRVQQRGHAVVVVAEGAGQEYLADGPDSVDASGNVRLRDIGSLLRKRIIEDFAAAGVDLNMRYFDPSYLIRSVPADPYDSMFCSRLAHAAVHAAMAGRTEVVVGRWHGRFVHLPMQLICAGRSQVSPDGDLWLSVLEATGQPQRFTSTPVPAR
ncbi:MAG: ATP-dependent 6-phosphofructokinase [Dactylosporangium sp.]|nr:ATP-dependent 6-phosphofructokinase [Dactylosporangium sp.]NNJ63402.1 ATP-dependent 6-phosphofructokinase [Dactylosporangium sp.]